MFGPTGLHASKPLRHMLGGGAGGVRRRLTLEYGEPPPLFLNAFPLSFGVQVICAVNFVCCIFVIALTSSVMPFYIGGYPVSPDVQVAIAAWHLLGIMLIVGALHGLMNYHEVGLRGYFYYLSLTAIFIALFLCDICLNARMCEVVSHSKESERIGASFSCGWVSGVWSLATLALLGLVSYSAYMVYHWKEFLILREEAMPLLKHEDPQIRNHRENGGHEWLERKMYKLRMEEQGMEEEVCDAPPGLLAAEERMPLNRSVSSLRPQQVIL